MRFRNATAFTGTILVSNFQPFELHDLDEREAVAFPLADPLMNAV